VAACFAERFGRPAHLVGVEGESALLNDAGRAHRRFGAPHVTAAEAMARVADWLEAGGRTLGKPTKFEVHDGRF
jgi:hypothetical protein